MTYHTRLLSLGVALALLATSACPGGDDGGGTGGASGSDGGAATGGAPGTGGVVATGGTPGTGGAVATGGTPGTGGAAATGGAPGTGGAAATGGTPGTGGAVATGGTPGTDAGADGAPASDPGAIMVPVDGASKTGAHNHSIAAIGSPYNGALSYYVAADNRLMAAGWYQGPYDLFGDGKAAGKGVNWEFVPIATSVVAIETYVDGVLVLRKDGSLWGTGDEVVLGFKLQASGYAPTRGFVKITTDVVGAAISAQGMLVVKSDGTLWATSALSYRSFGVAVAEAMKGGLHQVRTGVAAVAMGGNHLLVLGTDGTVVGVGEGLALGLAADTMTLTEVATGVEQVRTMNRCSYLVKTDKTLWVAGQSCEGHKGSDPAFEQAATDVVDATGGDFARFWKKPDGTLLGGGGSNYVEDGRGNTSHNGMMTVLMGAAAAAGGRNHSVALKTDGTIWETGGYRSDGTGGPQAKWSGVFVQTGMGALVP